MRGAVQRMIQRQLSMAWEQWQQGSASIRQHRMMMTRGQVFGDFSQMASAFMKWYQVAESVAEQRTMAHVAAHRVVHNSTSLALNKWRDDVELAKFMFCANHQAAICAGPLRLRSAYNRWRNVTVSLCQGQVEKLSPRSGTKCSEHKVPFQYLCLDCVISGLQGVWGTPWPPAEDDTDAVHKEEEAQVLIEQFRHSTCDHGDQGPCEKAPIYHRTLSSFE